MNPKFPAIPQRYTMEQVAAICGRSYAHLKRLFALGIPPEPRYARTYVRCGKRSRIREWTKEEALHLRKWFLQVTPGSIHWRKRTEKKQRG